MELSAYRDRYAEITSQKGAVIAVSTDDVATLKRFKESLKAPMHFVSDADKVLVRAYDLQGFLGNKRMTFVLGPGRKVLSIQEGMDAIAPQGAIRACALHKPTAVEAALKPAEKPAWAADAGVK
jgi:thioredoxin-dependent peroxiredoxin